MQSLPPSYPCFTSLAQYGKLSAGEKQLVLSKWYSFCSQMYLHDVMLNKARLLHVLSECVVARYCTNYTVGLDGEYEFVMHMWSVREDHKISAKYYSRQLAY